MAKKDDRTDRKKPSRKSWSKRDDINSKRFNEAILKALKNIDYQLSDDEMYSPQDRQEMKKGLAASDLMVIFGFRKENAARPWALGIREELIAQGCFEPSLTEYLLKVKRPDQEISNRCRTLLKGSVITAKKFDSRGIRRRRVIHYAISKERPLESENPLNVIETIKSFDSNDAKREQAVTIFGLSNLDKCRLDKDIQEELIDKANQLVNEFHNAWEQANHISEGDYIAMCAEKYFGRKVPIDDSNRRHREYPILVVNPNDMMRLSKTEVKEQERVWRLKQRAKSRLSEERRSKRKE